jgi:hypothetical protein
VAHVGELKVVIVTVHGTLKDVTASVKQAVKDALREHEQERAAESVAYGIKGQLRTTAGQS